MTRNQKRKREVRVALVRAAGLAGGGGFHMAATIGMVESLLLAQASMYANYNWGEAPREVRSVTVSVPRRLRRILGPSIRILP